MITATWKTSKIIYSLLLFTETNSFAIVSWSNASILEVAIDKKSESIIKCLVWHMHMVATS